MEVNALCRPVHLTKDVDRASVQREAIKLIKGMLYRVMVVYKRHNGLGENLDIE